MVPTMGALHAGHAALVERAARENDACVVSIFVNPLQFNETSDYEAYPKDMDEDLRLLEASGCDMAFTGTLMEFFPEHEEPRDIGRQDPGPFAKGLEGDFRPGHFAGVRTIVERLFETVRPDRAYFGEKDFQQTLVVKDLAKRLGYPQIVVCATAREPDGLAMSSRNRRLGGRDRAEAATIYRALVAARQAWRAGERRPRALSASMLEVLEKSALQVEYATVRDPLNWNEPEPDRPLARAQALIAARCGPVRLIDNLALDSETHWPD
jgi:pantoate--beta-alanine ligase